MKIAVNKPDSIVFRFNELTPGQTFQFGSKVGYYIRTDEYRNSHNAVRLSDGYMFHLSSDEIVYPIDLAVVLASSLEKSGA